MDRVANVASAIVMLAIIAVIFKSKQTQGIIKNFGQLFQGSITAAQHG